MHTFHGYDLQKHSINCLVNYYRNAHVWRAETKLCPITHIRLCCISLHVVLLLRKKPNNCPDFAFMNTEFQFRIVRVTIDLRLCVCVRVNVKTIGFVIRTHTNFRISELLACLRAQMENWFGFSLPTVRFSFGVVKLCTNMYVCANSIMCKVIL